MVIVWLVMQDRPSCLERDLGQLVFIPTPPVSQLCAFSVFFILFLTVDRPYFGFFRVSRAENDLPTNYMYKRA